MKKHSYQSGFTLIELSIVIVIIALILATVLAGQTMIRSSQIRGTVSEIEQLRSAIDAFQITYNFYPGDMPDARRYWPDVDQVSTENGNGNGHIADENSIDEPKRAWQHLALSKILSANYTGLDATTPGDYGRGENAPVSKITSTAAYIIGYDTATYRSHGNMIRLGSINDLSNVTGMPFGPVMSAIEAEKFDRKIDDGKASKGDIWAVRHPDNSGADRCVTGTVSQAANTIDYHRTGPRATELHCGIIIRLDTVSGCADASC